MQGQKTSKSYDDGCRTPCSEDRQQNLAGTDTSLFEKQVLAKVLTPGEFEFGLGSHSLSRYCYAPGEMILCRRNTEEWVRWHSPIQMLLITVPDQTGALRISKNPALEGTGTAGRRDYKICFVKSFQRAWKREEEGNFALLRLSSSPPLGETARWPVLARQPVRSDGHVPLRCGSCWKSFCPSPVHPKPQGPQRGLSPSQGRFEKLMELASRYHLDSPATI